MDMSMDSSASSSCEQSMLWTWSTTNTCFLTPTWHVTTPAAFAATCLGSFALSLALEALRRAGRAYDAWILRTFQSRAHFNAATTTLPPGTTVTFRASPLQQAVRAGIHGAALALAYVIMLLVMSFNGYVVVCVVLGGAVGKFGCDWMAGTVVVGGGADEDGMGGGKGVEDVKIVGSEEASVCCG